MMKRMIAILMMVFLTLSLLACNAREESVSTSETTEGETTAASMSSMEEGVTTKEDTTVTEEATTEEVTTEEVTTEVPTSTAGREPMDLTSGQITLENLDQVCRILEYAGLSNVEVFREWVKDYWAEEPEEEDGFSGFSDSDCRMTVMLLAGDRIQYDSLEGSYEGTYLMFDLDAMENEEAYAMLKDKVGLFTTMFGEMPIPDTSFADALPNRWKGHGIKVDSDKCAIISLLFKAYEEDVAFVGHAGLLIDCRDMKDLDSDYVFVEKIAFGDPFMVTLISDEAQLLEVLSQRPDYTTEEGDPIPVVYKNGEIMGELIR